MFTSLKTSCQIMFRICFTQFKISQIFLSYSSRQGYLSVKVEVGSENWRNSQISLKRCRVCERATADVEELSSVSSFEYYGSWFRRIGQGRHDLCSGELTASVPILSFPSISRSLTLAQSTSPLLVIQWLEVIHCVMINPGL